MPLTAAWPEGAGIPGGLQVLGAEWEALRSADPGPPTAQRASQLLLLSLWPAPTVRSAPGRGGQGVLGCLCRQAGSVFPTSPRSPFTSGHLLVLSPVLVGVCFLKKSAYCHFMEFASGVGVQSDAHAV